MSRRCKLERCGGPIPVTARADAEFCRPEHKSAWHNEQRRSQGTPAKRLGPVQHCVGSRGGTVRSVDDARILQSTSRELDRWRLVMELHIFETLVETGRFHVDDLDAIDAPPRAVEARGTLVNSIRARGFMKSTNVQRRVAHAAANARKAWIYEITPKGRRQIPKLLPARKNELVGLDGEREEGAGAHLLGDSVQPGDSVPGAEGSRDVGCTLPVDSLEGESPPSNQPSDKAPGGERPKVPSFLDPDVDWDRAA